MVTAILWAWIGTPIATIGVVATLLVADAQWRRAQEWRRRTWMPVAHKQTATKGN